MDDGEEVRKDEDRAFILRLPPNRAREVRQMLAENNLQELRLHVDPAPRQGQPNRWERARLGMCCAALRGSYSRVQYSDAPMLCRSVFLCASGGGRGCRERERESGGTLLLLLLKAVLLGMQDGKQFQGPYRHI
jgi:hypothetical protein